MLTCMSTTQSRVMPCSQRTGKIFRDQLRALATSFQSSTLRHANRFHGIMSASLHNFSTNGVELVANSTLRRPRSLARASFKSGSDFQYRAIAIESTWRTSFESASNPLSDEDEGLEGMAAMAATTASHTPDAGMGRRSSGSWREAVHIGVRVSFRSEVQCLMMAGTLTV